MRRILIVLLVIGALYACDSKQTDDDAKNEELTTANPGTAKIEAGMLVTVKKLSYEKFDHYFLVNGSLEAVNDAFISPEINGQIRKIHVKEGQRVKEGELLVSLNSDVTESAIAEVKTGLELARTIYKKRKGLWEKKIGSEVQYLEAKTNKESLENKLETLNAQLEMAKIKAPISGIVDRIFRKEGELAIPGMQLIQLVNLKKVYVNAEVSEAYISKVGKGNAVEVTFSSYPELTMETRIHRTGNVVNPTNRTFLVQLLLDNREEKLKPNMMALLKMKDFSADAALLVPSVIVKNDLKGSYLYVVQTNEKEGKRVAKKTYVETGMSEGGKTMITRGLEPGQQVVVKGYNLVKNGMRIKIES